MPTCRNSHTAMRSMSRSQCEMAQISKIEIERQVRFLAAQESRRDRRLFYSKMDSSGLIRYGVAGAGSTLEAFICAYSACSSAICEAASR
jgi:hypothetical protein